MCFVGVFFLTPCQEISELDYFCSGWGGEYPTRINQVFGYPFGPGNTRTLFGLVMLQFSFPRSVIRANSGRWRISDPNICLVAIPNTEHLTTVHIAKMQITYDENQVKIPQRKPNRFKELAKNRLTFSLSQAIISPKDTWKKKAVAAC